VLSTRLDTLLKDKVTGVRIQLLDLPGIVEGAAQGRGRGRQVVAGRTFLTFNLIWLIIDGYEVAKTADLVLIMLDATKSAEQRRLLEAELDAVGIRLNKPKPDGWYMFASC
jgi:uncharacterized protein